MKIIVFSVNWSCSLTLRHVHFSLRSSSQSTALGHRHKASMQALYILLSCRQQRRDGEPVAWMSYLFFTPGGRLLYGSEESLGIQMVGQYLPQYHISIFYCSQVFIGNMGINFDLNDQPYPSIVVWNNLFWVENKMGTLLWIRESEEIHWLCEQVCPSISTTVGKRENVFIFRALFGSEAGRRRGGLDGPSPFPPPSSPPPWRQARYF